MKMQTFISCYYENKDAKQAQYIDFDRWSFKKPETILKKVLQFIKNYPTLAKGYNYIRIYPTPDGYEMSDTPALVYDVKGEGTAERRLTALIYRELLAGARTAKSYHLAL